MDSPTISDIDPIKVVENTDDDEATIVYPFGPPTLYCDGVHIIRKVNEINGLFIGLRKGDHCMVPLNLARGLNNAVDSFVDSLADYDLVQFHHHFVCLDDIASLKQGEGEGYVAEFTNTPDDFIQNANQIGWSGAFLDKASYRKTPLSAYKGSLIFKVDEEQPLSEQQRQLIVERANQSISRSVGNSFPRYNFFFENCEHAASAVLQQNTLTNEDIFLKLKKHHNNDDDTIINNLINNDKNLIKKQEEEILSQVAQLQKSENINHEIKKSSNELSKDSFQELRQNKKNNDNDIKNKNENKNKESEKKENVESNTFLSKNKLKGSPQVNFAFWNTFRFSIQVFGIVFLYQIHASWWYWAAIGYCILSAAPVFMQSIAHLILNLYKLRILLLRGSLKQGGFRHLVIKEVFRCILVGFGSSLIIILMPIAVWSHYWPLSIASVVALVSYVVLNSIYSVIVKAIHKLILFIKIFIKKTKLRKWFVSSKKLHQFQPSIKVDGSCLDVPQLKKNKVN